MHGCVMFNMAAPRPDGRGFSIVKSDAAHGTALRLERGGGALLGGLRETTGVGYQVYLLLLQTGCVIG